MPGKKTERYKIKVEFEMEVADEKFYYNDPKKYDQSVPEKVRRAMWLRDQLQVCFNEGFIGGNFEIPSLVKHFKKVTPSTPYQR